MPVMGSRFGVIDPFLLGLRIECWRRCLGWSVGELARRMGCTELEVMRWEAGAGCEDWPMVVKLAGLFECPAGELVGYQR